MLDFSQATVLSYTHSPQFLGDSFRYKITKNITVEGWLLNLPNLSGVTGIYQDINTFLAGARDYDSILINGVNFGQGKITEIDFDRDDLFKDVKEKKYRASLLVYDSGNLFNAFSDYYSGLNWNNANVLENFEESFEYSRAADNSSSYSQQVNLRFNSGQNLPDTPIGMAKTFASGFFNALNITGFLGESYNRGYKQYYTESYNQIDNSVGFKREVDFPAESGSYAVTYNHAYELNTDGIINVIENGTIKGLYDPIYQSLQSGIAAEIPQAFNRCSGVFAYYAPSGCYPINANPIKKNNIINKFEGTANFSVQYTNDPRYFDIYVWEYTTTIDRNVERVYTVTENGKVDGIGRRLLNKYPNAESGYAIVKTGIFNRIATIYSGTNPFPLTLNPMSLSQGFASYEGIITYSSSYTDDITLFPASGIRKFEIEINDKLPVQLINKFNILGVKELVQPSNQSTLGVRDINVKMIGNRGLPISSYLNYASGQLSGYKNLGQDIWTSNAGYNYDPVNNNFVLNVTYNYDGVYKSFTDIMYNIPGY